MLVQEYIMSECIHRMACMDACAHTGARPRLEGPSSCAASSASSPTSRAMVPLSDESELHKSGHRTTGHSAEEQELLTTPCRFCKQFLSFRTVPCRPMPLLVHFRVRSLGALENRSLGQLSRIRAVRFRRGAPECQKHGLSAPHALDKSSTLPGAGPMYGAIQQVTASPHTKNPQD